MKTQNLSHLIPLFLALLLAGCEKENLPDNPELSTELEMKAKKEKVNTFYGPAQPFNNGVTRAVVTMSQDGTPISIGVKISEKVLEDLPEEHEILTLRLPNKAAGLPFDHIDLDWNPHGHDPGDLYGAQHFDFHFYMVSPEYKAGITDLEKAAIHPEAQYIPEGYVPPAPDVPLEHQLVPQMGVHWLNIFAPELGGADFTHTFIYGSYDGDFIFMEPMITLDYLLNEADGETFPIAQPQEFERDGYYYPTEYSIDYDPVKKEYTVIMSGMVLR